MPANAGNQQTYFQFALWALSLGRPPSVHEVEGFFGVSRTSAYRTHRNWLRALNHHRETTQRPAATGNKRPSRSPE